MFDTLSGRLEGITRRLRSKGRLTEADVDEVMREIREWESILSVIPSVRAYLVVTPKGKKSVKGQDDPILLFDGQRSLEEVVKDRKSTRLNSSYSSVSRMPSSA